MRRRTSLLLIAAALVVACTPPTPTLPVSVLVGDSISIPISPSGIGWVDASGSRTVWSSGRGPSTSGTGYEAILKAARIVEPGRWVVIELGTNDVTNPSSTYPWRVQQALDAVPKNRCVAWVTPHRSAVAYQQRIDIWVDEVRSRIAGHPCRAIVEWRAKASSTPGLLRSDGIHLTARGNEVLHDMIVDVVDG